MGDNNNADVMLCDTTHTTDAQDMNNVGNPLNVYATVATSPVSPVPPSSPASSKGADIFCLNATSSTTSKSNNSTDQSQNDPLRKRRRISDDVSTPSEIQTDAAQNLQENISSTGEAEDGPKKNKTKTRASKINTKIKVEHQVDAAKPQPKVPAPVPMRYHSFPLSKEAQSEKRWREHPSKPLELEGKELRDWMQKLNKKDRRHYSEVRRRMKNRGYATAKRSKCSQRMKELESTVDHLTKAIQELEKDNSLWRSRYEDVVSMAKSRGLQESDLNIVSS